MVHVLWMNGDRCNGMTAIQMHIECPCTVSACVCVCVCVWTCTMWATESKKRAKQHFCALTNRSTSKKPFKVSSQLINAVNTTQSLESHSLISVVVIYAVHVAGSSSIIQLHKQESTHACNSVVVNLAAWRCKPATFDMITKCVCNRVDIWSKRCQCCWYRSYTSAGIVHYCRCISFIFVLFIIYTATPFCFG